MTVERSVALVLHWSQWRRWHQAWARYYHQRRQERSLAKPPPVQVQAVAEELAAEQASDLVEIVWERLEPLLPPEKRTGHPYDYPRRLILEAIVYVIRTNCGWGNLPSQFPPWKTVYAQYAQWRKKGIWETIWSGIEKPLVSDKLQL